MAGDSDVDPVVDMDGDGSPADEDCDDANNTVYPDNTEVPYNGVDDDCDEATPDDDLDGDGFGEADDCDDTSADVNPDAVESCNGVDDDCDGEVDDAVGDLWFADVDEDGFGDPATEVQSCDGVSGTVADDTDCDDTDETVFPGADEVCNEADDDCDGVVDEDVQTTFYVDADGDGHGSADLTTQACDPPTGFAATDDDCNDDDATVSPNATELCDAFDNDCDGDIDEADAADAPTWYADADADGYGTSDTTLAACHETSGYVDNDDDCDDSDADLNPDTVWYLDADADGYGGTWTLASCEQPSGYVDESTDCDDLDADVAPWFTWYADTDADGFGDSTSTSESCTEPSGYVDDDTDCDDTSDDSYPGAEELCDGEDNDCDGTSDVGVLGSGEDCPAESCAEVLADDSSATDGAYWLDPTGSGMVEEWTCDMTTDGGGWTLILDWNRVDDGDTQADFEALFTENENNFADWTAGTSYIQWSDLDGTADVLDYEADVDVPNDGEALVELDFDGNSHEDSSIFFSGETASSVEEILCRTYNNYSSSGWTAWSSAEQTYIPYTCSSVSSSSVTYTLDGQNQAALSAEIEVFRVTSLMYDINYGDTSRLYELAFWVR